MAIDETQLGNILRDVENKGGPASENTLEEVVKALREGFKLEGSTKSPQQRRAEENLKRQNNQQQQLIKGMGSRADREKEYQERLRKYRRSLDALVDVTNMLSGGMQQFSNGLRSLSRDLPLLLGAGVRGFAELFDLTGDSVKMYRQLATVGALFGAEIEDVRKIAARTGLDFDVLAKGLAAAGQNLALMGGNASAGAKQFAGVLEELRQGDTFQNLSALGFTMEDIAAGAGDYLSIQTQLGRSQQMSQAELATGTADYLNQLDVLTKLTGKNREALSQEMVNRANDERLKLQMGQMTADQQAEMNKGFALLETISPQLADNFKNIVAQGGLAFTEQEAGILGMRGMNDAMRAFKSGSPGSVEAVMNVLKNQAAATKAMGPGMAQITALQKRAGVSYFDFIFQTQNAANVMDKFAEAEKLREMQLTKNNTGMAQFDMALMKLRTAFVNIFTPVINIFDQMAGVLAIVIGGMADFIVAIQKAVPVLNQLVGVGATAGLGIGAYKVGKAGLGIARNIGGKMIGGARSLMSGAGSTSGAAGPGMNVLQAVGKGGGGMMTGAATGLKAFARGGASILGGAAVIAGVIAILGAGVGASAYLAGKGLGSFAESLQKFGEVDGENLSKVAKGAGQLSLAMVGMAGATGITGITGFFGKIFGGGPENFAKSINATLDALDKNKIDMYATSLDNLGNAFAKFDTSMTGVTTTASKTTSDKLEVLNNTMTQILQVMQENTEYTRKNLKKNPSEAIT